MIISRLRIARMAPSLTSRFQWLRTHQCSHSMMKRKSSRGMFQWVLQNQCWSSFTICSSVSCRAARDAGRYMEHYTENRCVRACVRIYCILVDDCVIYPSAACKKTDSDLWFTRLWLRAEQQQRMKRIDDATPDDPYIYIYMRIEFDEWIYIRLPDKYSYAIVHNILIRTYTKSSVRQELRDFILYK